MFGNKLATATAQITALLAALKGIGFEAATAEAVDAAALQTHLAARENAAAEAATAPLQAQLAAYTTGLAAAGITVALVDGKLSAADVKAAVEAKIAAVAQAKAVETVASSGHAAALAVPSTEGTGPAADATPASAEEFLAASAAIADPAARTAYFRKHSSRFSVR